ncbi:MAG: hypothetical protein IT585_15110 [candidate division Zixibacteria bacterium]|nr:hypothetical protein [candidate division Zixibacteria bacterium]
MRNQACGRVQSIAKTIGAANALDQPPATGVGSPERSPALDPAAELRRLRIGIELLKKQLDE